MFTSKKQGTPDGSNEIKVGQSMGFDAAFDDDFTDDFDAVGNAPVGAPGGNKNEPTVFTAPRRQNERARKSFSPFASDGEKKADDAQSVPSFVSRTSERGEKQQSTTLPVSDRAQEIVSVEGGGSLFGQLKTRAAALVSGKNEKEITENYYIPPEGFAPTRKRYRVFNHHPMPVWIKSAALGVCLLAVIALTTALIFFGSMVGQVNYVNSKSHASVHLTLDESEAMKAQLSEEVVNDITPAELEVRTNDNIQLILLVGVSNAIGSGNAGECDAIVLVALDHVHDKVKLVSIARELYAQIPDYRNNMIGEAFFYDSASGNRTLDILRESIETNLCVKIDSIVSIDYESLQTIVNKLGGITMTLTNEEALYMSTDSKYGSFPRYTAGGIYTMSGAEMLNYLRMLNIGEKTDAERVTRLRTVMQTIFNSTREASTIERTAAIYSVLPYITTDMSPYEVYKIVSSAGRLSNYELVGCSLPVNGSWDYDIAEINGVKTQVVVANYSFNAEYLQKLIYDDDLTYTNGNSTNGVDVPYISEEGKLAAQS